MKKKEKQALGNYIRAMADLLWMRDWDFDVYYEKPETPERSADDQEWGASVEQTRHRQHAAITIPEDFRTNPAYEGIKGKQTIAHELIHMHWARCWDMIRVDLRNLDGMSQTTYDLFVANYERNMEYGVDALAYAFAEFMPDIDWEFTKK
jgi:hypothetical protein